MRSPLRCRKLYICNTSCVESNMGDPNSPPRSILEALNGDDDGVSFSGAWVADNNAHSASARDDSVGDPVLDDPEMVRPPL